MAEEVATKKGSRDLNGDSEKDSKRGLKRKHEPDLMLADKVQTPLQSRCALAGPSQFPPSKMPKSDDKKSDEESAVDKLIDLTQGWTLKS